MERVYIPSTHDPKPMYHQEHLVDTQGPYGKVKRVQTVCGKGTSFGQQSLRLPRSWADKFAEACEECFPI